MKIFITGCAKTGTTLVRRLFNAFDLKVYNRNEMSLQWFMNSNYQVAKRTVQSPFSNVYTMKERLLDDLDIIRINRLTVINVTRNRKDTLKSDGGYVTPERYDECMRQAEHYKDYIAFTIPYERLMLEPDVIQQELADKLRLTILHKWSSYPDFVNISEESKHTHEGIYKLRPIGG